MSLFLDNGGNPEEAESLNFKNEFGQMEHDLDDSADLPLKFADPDEEGPAINHGVGDHADMSGLAELFGMNQSTTESNTSGPINNSIIISSSDGNTNVQMADDAQVNEAVHHVTKVFSKPEIEKRRFTAAVSEIVNGRLTIKEASVQYMFATSTLHPYVHKARFVLGDAAPPLKNPPRSLKQQFSTPKCLLSANQEEARRLQSMQEVYKTATTTSTPAATSSSGTNSNGLFADSFNSDNASGWIDSDSPAAGDQSPEYEDETDGDEQPVKPLTVEEAAREAISQVDMDEESKTQLFLAVTSCLQQQSTLTQAANEYCFEVQLISQSVSDAQTLLEQTGSPQTRTPAQGQGQCGQSPSSIMPNAMPNMNISSRHYAGHNPINLPSQSVIDQSIQRITAASLYNGHSRTKLHQAVNDAVRGVMPLTQAAALYAIPFSTLHPYVKRVRLDLGLVESIQSASGSPQNRPISTKFNAPNRPNIAPKRASNSVYTIATGMPQAKKHCDNTRTTTDRPIGMFRPFTIPDSWRQNPKVMQAAVMRAVSSCQYDDHNKKQRLARAVYEAIAGTKTLKQAGLDNVVPITTLQTYFHRSRVALAKLMGEDVDILNAPQHHKHQPKIVVSSANNHSNNSTNSTATSSSKVTAASVSAGGPVKDPSSTAAALVANISTHDQQALINLLTKSLANQNKELQLNASNGTEASTSSNSDSHNSNGNANMNGNGQISEQVRKQKRSALDDLFTRLRHEKEASHDTSREGSATLNEADDQKTCSSANGSVTPSQTSGSNRRKASNTQKYGVNTNAMQHNNAAVKEQSSTGYLGTETLDGRSDWPSLDDEDEKPTNSTNEDSSILMFGDDSINDDDEFGLALDQGDHLMPLPVGSTDMDDDDWTKDLYMDSNMSAPEPVDHRPLPKGMTIEKVVLQATRNSHVIGTNRDNMIAALVDAVTNNVQLKDAARNYNTPLNALHTYYHRAKAMVTALRDGQEPSVVMAMSASQASAEARRTKDVASGLLAGLDRSKLSQMDLCHEAVKRVCRSSLYSPDQKERLCRAVDAVIIGELTINAAANQYGLPSSTVHPYVHRARALLGDDLPQQAVALVPSSSSNQSAFLSGNSPTQSAFSTAFDSSNGKLSAKAILKAVKDQQREQGAEGLDGCVSVASLDTDNVKHVITELCRASLYDNAGRQRLEDAVYAVVMEQANTSESARMHQVPPSTIQPYVQKTRVALGLPTNSLANTNSAKKIGHGGYGMSSASTRSPSMVVSSPASTNQQAATSSPTNYKLLTHNNSSQQYATPGEEASREEIEAVAVQVIKSCALIGDKRVRLQQAVIAAVSGELGVKDACTINELNSSTVHPYVSRARALLGASCPAPKQPKSATSISFNSNLGSNCALIDSLTASKEDVIDDGQKLTEDLLKILSRYNYKADINILVEAIRQVIGERRPLLEVSATCLIAQTTLSTYVRIARLFLKQAENNRLNTSDRIRMPENEDKPMINTNNVNMNAAFEREHTPANNDNHHNPLQSTSPTLPTLKDANSSIQFEAPLTAIKAENFASVETEMDLKQNEGENNEESDSMDCEPVTVNAPVGVSVSAPHIANTPTTPTNKHVGRPVGTTKAVMVSAAAATASTSLHQQPTTVDLEDYSEYLDGFMGPAKPEVHVCEAEIQEGRSRACVRYLVKCQFRRAAFAQQMLMDAAEDVLLSGLSVQESVACHSGVSEHVLCIYLQRMRQANHVFDTQLPGLIECASNMDMAQVEQYEREQEHQPVAGSKRSVRSTTPGAHTNNNKADKKVSQSPVRISRRLQAKLEEKKRSELNLPGPLMDKFVTFLKLLESVSFPLPVAFVCGMAGRLMALLDSQHFYTAEDASQECWTEWYKQSLKKLLTDKNNTKLPITE